MNRALRDRYALRSIVRDDARRARFERFMEPAGLVVGGAIQPNWMLDGAGFWFAEGAPDDTVIFRVDGGTGEIARLFDVRRTNQALGMLLGRDLSFRGLPFDSVVELSDGHYRFVFEGHEYVLLVDSYRIERLAAVDQLAKPRAYRRPGWLTEPLPVSETPSPDGQWFASLQNGNIVLRARADDRTVQLTSDGTPDFSWDVESIRPTLTAGMTPGRRFLNPWSPDGNWVFAVKVDRRAVPELPFVRYLKREEEACSHKIQRAGGPMDIAHPHVIDVLARRARPLHLGDTEDQFITLLGWLPDGSQVLFTRHSRDFKTVEVLAGNPYDETVRTVLSESAPTFVALQHDVIFFGDNHAAILPDGSGLIWRSSRSGWNHFYVYAFDGASPRTLTAGEFPVIDVVAVDQDDGSVYFTAHHDQDRPYDTHLCRVSLTGGAIERLTPLDGENVVSISPQKKTFTVVNSRPDRPFSTEFYRCDGKLLAKVRRADTTRLEALGYVTSEEFTVLAADGKTVLSGVMHKPADFDPDKQYAVIDHLYGGPQITIVSRNFGLGDNTRSRLDRALAQLDYIVISIDTRGTPERSKAFQDVVYRNWGRHEIADHVAVLRQLGERHAFIDLDRVGVWGHSWGGHFALRALAQAPEAFHVGVASAPGFDPYDLILYEPYLDLPTRAKEAYDYARLYAWAHSIRGKLMMIAGTADSMVYANAVEMAHHLIQAGVDHEFVVLPEAAHSFQGRNDDYFVHKVVQHFERHLKPRQAGRWP